MMRQSQREVSMKLNEASLESSKPTQEKQQTLQGDIERKKDRLELRRKERIVVASSFYTYEDNWSALIEKRRIEEEKDISKELSKIKAALIFCDVYEETPAEYLEEILSQSLCEILIRFPLACFVLFYTKYLLNELQQLRTVRV